MSDAVGVMVGLLLLARDEAHKEHWRTKSYAQHMALGAFYEGIVGLADDLVEAYQGKHGRVQVEMLAPPEKADPDIAATLKDQLKWIERTRYEAIPRSDTALHNIVDEIVALYQKTLYLLTLE